MQHLEEYRFLGEYYLISIDGTEYFGSEKIGCMKCLRKKSKGGEVRYYHQILQSTLVAPGRRQVIPLGLLSLSVTGTLREHRTVSWRRASG